jgi:microcystin-dependent protein
MPSSNGVYSLPPGYLAVTGATIQASQHNPPFEDVAAALTARLSRDGTAAMTGPLQAAPGTVGAPGSVFSTDLTTGFYKTTSGIGVSIGGTKVSEFTAAGIASGVWSPGMIIPWALTTVPNSLWVMPYGQTLSRTSYAVLWALAQIEIAAGNTFFTNGDGSTTFGIGDLRGRVPFAWDKMGGSASGRLTTAGGGVDGTTLGATGGAQNTTLITANLPPYTPSGTVAISQINTLNSTAGPGSVGNISVPSTVGGSLYLNSGTFTGSAQGGTSTAFSNVPPAIVTNFILFAGGAS